MISNVGEGTNDDSSFQVAAGGHEPPPEGASGPLRVLFVCTANICRSAYAEVAARHLLGANPDVVVGSAGTHARSGQPLNREIAEFLPPGASPYGFASRRVTPTLVDEADLVLTMEASHRAYLLEQDPRVFRKVLTLGQFAEAAAASELRGRDLIAEVGRRQPAARADHDVPDPYRRGRAANAAAATRIDELLATIVPALTTTSRP